MENQELNLFSLSIDHTSKAHIRNMIAWVRIIVICGVIGIILSLYEFTRPAPKVILNESGYNAPSVRGENVVTVMISLIVNVVILIFLYNFLRFTKKGVEQSSITDTSKGFLNLKNYFLTGSVVLIIVIFLLLISLLFIGTM